MVALLISLGKLALGFAGICGLPLAVLLLLNGRDRRHALLGATVARQLNTPSLRGLTTVRITGFWPNRETVAVELWHCSRNQVWDVLEGLWQVLPETVRVQVNGSGECRSKATWTLTMTGRCPSMACWT